MPDAGCRMPADLTRLRLPPRRLSVRTAAVNRLASDALGEENRKLRQAAALQKPADAGTMTRWPQAILECGRLRPLSHAVELA